MLILGELEKSLVTEYSFIDRNQVISVGKIGN